MDKIAPRPILFVTTDDDRSYRRRSRARYARAGEPKKLVVLEGFGHYEVYREPAWRS